MTLDEQCMNCRSSPRSPESGIPGFCLDCNPVRDAISTAPVCSRCGLELFQSESIESGYCNHCRLRIRKEGIFSKDTENPKEAPGKSKYRMSVLPACVMGEVSVAMLEGAYKYGAYNYRDTNIKSDTYYDSVMRHIMAWWEGEDIDPDSNISHVTKAITSLVVLRDAMINGKLIDNRPKKCKNGWADEINIKAKELAGKYEK